MDMVKALAVAALMAIALVTRAATASANVETTLDQWQPLISEAAQRFAIPAPWIRDVMRAESAGQAMLDGRPTTSSAGAMGLMQIMPATYAELRHRYGLGADPHDARDNILAGTAYLRELYERYGWPSLFAAYHAGPTRFEAFLSTGKPLPKATHDYLDALVPELAEFGRSQVQRATAASIFVSLTRSVRAAATSPSRSLDTRLFVPLRSATGVADAPVADRSSALPEASNALVP